ncbi:MAG: PAS domain S-box protein [Desulfomonile tiedjei]|uniref:histidine kinase n=1 Tax=Desulfomonile tiedjei TaxID=2358 RepID=A0A9D6Z3A6_9BACT|nr:PAS domain S-box protein [Desulfomonile tiedjei]
MPTQYDPCLKETASTSPPRASEIRAAKIHQLYSQGRTGFIGALIGAIILTGALWKVVSHVYLAIWLLACILAHVPRYALLKSYFKISPTPSEAPLWERKLAFGNFVAGVLWGVAAIVFFPTDSIHHQFMLGVVIAGISSGAAAFYWPSTYAYFPTILVELLPLSARFFYEGGEVNIVIGTVVLIFCVVVLLMARYLNSFATESLRLRFERQDLLDSLQAARDELETRVTERTAEIASVNHALRSEINERVRVEQALRESEERYRAVFNNASVGINMSNRHGKFLETNSASSHMLGYTQSELELLSVFDVTHPDDLEASRRKLSELVESQIQSYRIENRYIRKDGEIIWVDLSVSAIQNTKGDCLTTLTVVVDITERKRAEQERENLREQLLQAQKMEAIGTLAGGIAHDFNNLLQVTLGYSDLMLSEKSLNEPDYADLQKIGQAARSGAELVQSLLTCSRKTQPNPVHLNLNEQIRHVEALLRRTFPKMIDIVLDLEEDSRRIYADPTQMEQILMNLAVNSRDSMADGGTLTLATQHAELDEDYCKRVAGARPGGYVVLSVSDTGHGMDSETLQHIFEPFYTTKEFGRGTGLGLAMVYGIVKQHGGHIVCHSKVGKGTTFRVYLPSIPEETAPEVESSGEMPAFGTETVLLVDDEDLVRELGYRILRRSGYTVLTAANGVEALDVFIRQKDLVALIILDLIMPSMGGKECLKELMKIDPQVKVLVASGYSVDASTQEALGMGAKGFVGKPFRFRELLKQVRKTLDRS